MGSNTELTQKMFTDTERLNTLQKQIDLVVDTDFDFVVVADFYNNTDFSQEDVLTCIAPYGFECHRSMQIVYAEYVLDKLGIKAATNLYSIMG